MFDKDAEMIRAIEMYRNILQFSGRENREVEHPDFGRAILYSGGTASETLTSDLRNLMDPVIEETRLIVAEVLDDDAIILLMQHPNPHGPGERQFAYGAIASVETDDDISHAFLSWLFGAFKEDWSA